MITFEAAIPIVLEHEKGLADNPKDPGGITNWGISLRWLKGLKDEDGDGFLDGDWNKDGITDWKDIANMSLEQATILYEKYWWNPVYLKFPFQELATKCFDLSVNMGEIPAHRLLQRAMRSVGKRVSDDGKIGPITLNSLSLVSRDIIPAYRSEAAGYYRLICAKNQDMKWALNGWLNRAYF